MRTRRSPSRRAEPSRRTGAGRTICLWMLPPGARCPRRGHRSAPRRFDLWAGDGTGTRMANSGESSRTEFWLALEHARCIPVPIRNRPPQGGEGGRFAAPPGLGGRYPDLRRDNERYAATRGRGRIGIYSRQPRGHRALPRFARDRGIPHRIAFIVRTLARIGPRVLEISRDLCRHRSRVKNSRPRASLRGCKPAPASQPNGCALQTGATGSFEHAPPFLADRRFPGPPNRSGHGDRRATWRRVPDLSTPWSPRCSIQSGNAPWPEPRMDRYRNITRRRTAMAKGRQRGNREPKKPKAAKPSAVSTTPRPPAPPMPPAQKGKSSGT